VVVPSYRQAPFLEQTLDSILAQRYPDLELIVVDGGSEDGSQAIIRNYADRLHWWCSEPDNGQTDALNKGFLQAGGEIMAWLNADDCHVADTLWRVADFMGRRPDVDVVYGHRLLMDRHGGEIGRWILPPHDNGVLSWADFVPQETLFWRRRIWEKTGGGLDTSFDFAMDWDLLLRFRDAGAKFVRLPEFLGLFRIHAGQKTSCRIDEIGFKEMQRLRSRSLGFEPTQSQCAMHVAWFLFKAWFFERFNRV
jgi:glycosyltransferase involved in cell wall biosynthesis